MADQGGGAVPTRQEANNNVEERFVPTNQFGAVRERLFMAILIRVAVSYNATVSLIWRRAIEFCSLITAISMLFLLIFVHYMSARANISCLNHLQESWSTDGVLHVQIIENLDMLDYKEVWMRWYTSERSKLVCEFNPMDVFLHGPSVMPAEVREGTKNSVFSLQPVGPPLNEPINSSRPLLSHFLHSSHNYANDESDNTEEDDDDSYRLYNSESLENPYLEDAKMEFADMFYQKYGKDRVPKALFRVEYALLYGVLKLPEDYRELKNIPTIRVRIDANSECLGDTFMRSTIHSLIGYHDPMITAFRKLASDKARDDHNGLGYLHNLDTNEHFHFVTNGPSKFSYISAAVCMVCFTFAISLLLRFSHHQIFVFIVDLLHMFETNQPLRFPAAPLLTVVLALVGMEAIMTEVFSDTSTAFYVILVVWVADQYDTICCHSAVSKRYWLRFFYLYQFFFYAYQYRFPNGSHGGIALIASSCFITHSMIFFFHHYEMPLILHQERLQRLLSELQAHQRMAPTPIVRLSSTGSPVNPPARDNFETNGSTSVTIQEATTSSSASASVLASVVPEGEDSPSTYDRSTTLNGSQEVFDSRSPSPNQLELVFTEPEEVVAEGLVSDAINELL